MDHIELFKYLIELNGYEKARCFEEKWVTQIHKLHEYWDKLLDIIDRREFRMQFDKESVKLGLLHPETFDLNAAFDNARSKWKVSLMTRTANHIASFHVRRCIKDPKLVRWNGKYMQIQWKLLKIELTKQSKELWIRKEMKSSSF